MIRRWILETSQPASGAVNADPIANGVSSSPAPSGEKPIPSCR